MMASQKSTNAILSVIGKDSTIIPYRRELAVLTGTTNSAILLGQLLYWYEKMGRKPFFKYKEPPQRKDDETDDQYYERVYPYKEGDSWTEELYFSKREFDTALSNIAHNRTKGLTEKEIKDQPFRQYIHFWTTRDRLTYYDIKEPKALSKLLDALFLSDKLCFRKDTKKDLDIIQRILTETTSILSKDNSTNPKTDLHNDKILGNQESPPEKQDNNIGSKQGGAKSLRDKAKDVKQEPKPKKPKKNHKILEANQPYWDIATEYDIKIPKRAWARNYKTTDGIFTELREGTYFENIPGCEHLIGRKITPEDFDRFCYNFSLAVNSPEYKPKSLSVKKSWKGWYLEIILYKDDSKNRDGKSLFAIYLDKPPEKVESAERLIKDPDPNITNFVIEEVQKRYGWDLSNGGRNTAIRCTKKLTQFFADNKDRMPLYDIHYSLVPQKVGILLEALEKNEYADRPMEPMYLYGDLTYSKFLPKHLKYVGSMND